MSELSVKTRLRNWTHLHDLVGSSRQLPTSELPTARDLIRYGLYLRETSEEDKRNYTNDKLVSDMMNGVLVQWSIANPKFIEPVINSNTRIKAKLKTLWEEANKVSLGRAKQQEKDKFMEKLDKLVDLLTCKCIIRSCAETQCNSACVSSVHIFCDCRRDTKIPFIELAFIKGQREKVGSVGPHQIGSVDFQECRRQDMQKRRLEKIVEATEKKKRKSEKKTVEEEDVMQKYMLEVEQEEKAEELLDECCKEDSNKTCATRKTAKYNTGDISNIALASLRHHTGLRETAEIATAAWIDAGVINKDDTSLVIDHNKVKRAQEKIMKKINVQLDEEHQLNSINCIFFDGRIDQTKIMVQAEENQKYYPSMLKEEHYTICKEPGGKYLWHFVPDKATKEKSHAETIADNIIEWLKAKGSDKTLQAIGGDSCNVNTGWGGGVMQYVEKKLQRKLVWIVCDLHTGELPLRRLITALDGKTLSNNKWSGPLGKMLNSATELDINPDFPKICIGPQLPQLNDEVIKTLSTDQSYGYRILSAIRTGVLPRDLAMLEIGPVSHSRWLTTGLRFMRIWVSKHNLEGENLENLKKIVEYCVGVYMINWFNIKINSRWTEGPNHILFQLQLLREQCEEVRTIVMPAVKRSAWYGFSECVLQAMLCSEDELERKDAVEKILKIRGGGDEMTQLGDSNVRPRRTQNINTDAAALSQLIDWSSNVSEPPLTCYLTTSEVKAFVNKPMTVPDWPSHTQSVERCVKMTSEAAAHVYSHERRDQYIRGQMISRQLMSTNRSKQDMIPLIDSFS